MEAEMVREHMNWARHWDNGRAQENGWQSSGYTDWWEMIGDRILHIGAMESRKNLTKWIFTHPVGKSTKFGQIPRNLHSSENIHLALEK